MEIIKCECGQDDCESTLELYENGMIYVREKSTLYNNGASFHLPLYVAKAIAKALQEPHIRSNK
jgi:hypothetical protein